MLRALLLGSALLFSFPVFAAKVVCTSPSMGVLRIDGALDDCRVKLTLPDRQTWFSGRCSEIYDGATYKMSAEMYSEGSPVNPILVITRGTSADVRFVQLNVTENISMSFDKISCQYK